MGGRVSVASQTLSTETPDPYAAKDAPTVSNDKAKRSRRQRRPRTEIDTKLGQSRVVPVKKRPPQATTPPRAKSPPPLPPRASVATQLEELAAATEARTKCRVPTAGERVPEEARAERPRESEKGRVERPPAPPPPNRQSDKARVERPPPPKREPELRSDAPSPKVDGVEAAPRSTTQALPALPAAPPLPPPHERPKRPPREEHALPAEARFRWPIPPQLPGAGGALGMAPPPRWPLPPQQHQLSAPKAKIRPNAQTRSSAELERPKPPPPPSSRSAPTYSTRMRPKRPRWTWGAVAFAVFAGVGWWRLEQAGQVPPPSAVIPRDTPTTTLSGPVAAAPAPSSATLPMPSASDRLSSPSLVVVNSALLGVVRVPRVANERRPMGGEVALLGAPASARGEVEPNAVRVLEGPLSPGFLTATSPRATPTASDEPDRSRPPTVGVESKSRRAAPQASSPTTPPRWTTARPRPTTVTSGLSRRSPEPTVRAPGRPVDPPRAPDPTVYDRANEKLEKLMTKPVSTEPEGE